MHLRGHTIWQFCLYWSGGGGWAELLGYSVSGTPHVSCLPPCSASLPPPLRDIATPSPILTTTRRLPAAADPRIGLCLAVICDSLVYSFAVDWVQCRLYTMKGMIPHPRPSKHIRIDKTFTKFRLSHKISKELLVQDAVHYIIRAPCIIKHDLGARLIKFVLRALLSSFLFFRDGYGVPNSFKRRYFCFTLDLN